MLAFATKELVQTSSESVFILNREYVEKDLTFLGLMVTENKLKPDSRSVIKKLNWAGVRTVIASGDNVLTTISVARQCKAISQTAAVYIGEVRPNGDQEPTLIWSICKPIQEPIIKRQNSDISDKSNHSSFVSFTTPSQLAEIPPGEEFSLPWFHKGKSEVALTGPAFRLLESKKLQNLVMFKAIIAKCQVYARMSPEEKMLLVNCLQMDDQKVAMCGDGSNDCEALKAADIGVSLGQAEASIAAPFTSKSESIECCLTVLKEGKASVATMIQSFKATEIYSMIQLF